MSVRTNRTRSMSRGESFDDRLYILFCFLFFLVGNWWDPQVVEGLTGEFGQREKDILRKRISSNLIVQVDLPFLSECVTLDDFYTLDLVPKLLRIFKGSLYGVREFLHQWFFSTISHFRWYEVRYHSIQVPLFRFDHFLTFDLVKIRTGVLFVVEESGRVFLTGSRKRITTSFLLHEIGK